MLRVNKMMGQAREEGVLHRRSLKKVVEVDSAFEKQGGGGVADH